MIPKAIKTAFGIYNIIYVSVYGWYIATDSSYMSNLINKTYKLNLRRKGDEIFPWCSYEQMVEVIAKIKAMKSFNIFYKKYVIYIQQAGTPHDVVIINNTLLIDEHEVSTKEITKFAKALQAPAAQEGAVGKYDYYCGAATIRIGCRQYPTSKFRNKFLKIIYQAYPNLKPIL